MEDQGEVPLPIKVGVAYNLKKGLASEKEDVEAEFDSPDTISALESVFRKAGFATALLEADAFFVEKLQKEKPDLVFNIAEGQSGRSREGQVPAILSF